MPKNFAFYLFPLVVIFSVKSGDNVELQNVGENSINYRLPNETYPTHYEIKLTTNVHAGVKFFQGDVVVDIVVAKATNNIVLHARELVITKVLIMNTFSGESEELSNKYELEREFLTLTRKNNQEFPAGTKWKLTINYSGKLRDDHTGFYLTEYTDDAGNKHYLSATHFESTNARQAFPCYDEPDKLTSFTITVNHSPTYTAISNIPRNEDVSSSGKTVFFTATPTASYTISFVVSDFEYTEGILCGLTQRVYSRPNAKNEHTFALVTGMLVVSHLSEHYGIEFKRLEINHVAIPNFPSDAMKNWNLLTYPERSLLYNEKTSKEYSQNLIAIDVAHQIARQWFGDYVAIKWWSGLWLKEGFANLFAYKALDHAYPEWDIWQEFHVMFYQNALDNDVGFSSSALTVHVQKPAEITSLYDDVSYAKHGALLLMWNHALTDRVFQKGFEKFLMKNQYSAVEEEDLYAAIETVANEENCKIPATISQMISTWTLQSGYPIVTVTRNYADGTFSIKQEAFNDDETVRENKTWYVPINYAVASNPDFRDTEATLYLANVAAMKVDDVRIPKNDWLLLNKQTTGYYRVNCDDENWNLIADGLIERPSTIHWRNRAQLIDDSYRLNHPIHVKLLSYLKQEDQLAPWNTALFILEKYNRYLRGDVKYDDFKYFVAQLVTPAYRKFGVTEISGESHNDKFTRLSVAYVACIIGVRECLKETNDKLRDQFYKNITIEANLIDTVYAFGLRQSSDELFDLVYQKLVNSTDSDTRNQLIICMAYAQKENHIKKFIYSSIDQSNMLQPNERHMLLRKSYSKGGVSFLTCIKFLNENWNVYGNLKKNNSNPLNDDILGMASYVTNKKEEKLLLALVAKVRKSKHVTPALEFKVKRRIERNFQWLRRHGKPIMAWISQYRAASERSGTALKVTII